MKAVGFNGSPRSDGNTAILIERVFDELRDHDVECELVQVGGEPVRGCTSCRECFDNKDMKCVIDDDIINDCIKKMADADCIIIGSPTYYSDLTTETKALIDRAGYVSSANDNLLRRKVGAGVSAVRRAGSIPTLDSINHFFLINEMIVPGSSYWNLGIGGAKGEVLDDSEGMQTMRDLGRNIAWLLDKTR
ncbi:flavodoxin family protein [Methanonatronarchaeum sp. AMET6-2]|uniref:flavodoxin family protein n=1 Tax=Methanonatronarchaeum sp. AMET6-2 TaxID=2933293 RepID=UPI00120F5DAA|nr:flavodoxin family protein [Methanonatronarchaeum sp. AMET6-2]RZN62226.1 MAG: flavodoxin family protein [Methanonatronarchaeia archaeon]UOY10439.1 flavodoxin family protein [Methanonatronarchaeum sp. AMET6-2]